MLFRHDFPTIVMLHYVSDDPAHDGLKPWSIARASFIRLLDFLHKENYTTVVFEDLISSNIKGLKNIIITFDDCPKQLWDFAIPELQKRNMKAVFYMPTAHLGGYNEWNVVNGKPRIDLMDEDDIARLIEIGMEVGSHAHNHIMLEEKDEEEVVRQLNKSKSLLESVIKKPVLSVAYPYGSLPHGYSKLVERTGYKFGLGVFVPWQSRYAIRRWVFDDTDTVNSIKRKMSQSYNFYRVWLDKKDHYSKKIFRRVYNIYMSIKNGIKANAILAITFTQNLQCSELLATLPSNIQ